MITNIYNLIIAPLITIIEFVYSFCLKIADNPGFAIIGVSIVVTLLCLPLYAVAEKLQEEERKIQKQLKPKVDKIKAVFKGDEQYMILSTYYKQNHYHPIYALRSSISLLIQIPFFMAAYSFLSNLGALQGKSFYFIKDLGAQDAMIHIGNFTVNLLPILMTLINCIAGAIYTKGFPIKEKLQLYGMALFFLVLLYTSPAGLVLYWTMNNVFSLVKNVFYKTKNPLKIFYYFLSTCLILANIFLFVFIDADLTKKFFVVVFSLFIIATPFLYKVLTPLLKKALSPLYNNIKITNSIFIFSCLNMALLVGLVIPTNTISSSTADFCFIGDLTTPYLFITTTLLKALGMFVLWPCCFYFMFSKKVKTILSFTSSIIFISAVINNFVYTNISLTMSNTYVFNFNYISKLSMIVNILILFLASIALVFIIYKFVRFTNFITIIAFITFLSVSFININTIKNEYDKLAQIKKSITEVECIEPVYHLSKDKNNVIVIMLDRAVSMFVSEIFEENNLYDQYKGFKFYPNSLSTAKFTNMGAPGLSGGYEYSPYNSNKRDNESLLEKHNESLKVLPKLFSENEYNVNVSDSPLANLSVSNDMSIFDGMKNVNAINVSGQYTKIWCEKNNYELVDTTKYSILRNTLWYSFLKISPQIFRKHIYDFGSYWNAGSTKIKASGNTSFVDAYSMLDLLNELVIADSEKPTYTFINNDLPHNDCPLQLPEYKLINDVDNSNYSELQQNTNYQSNVASLLLLGKFFDYLREQNIYDNTRIIIVSDHGFDSIKNFEDDPFKKDLDNYRYRLNCLLLVKDFNSDIEFTVDNSFMTNADTPYLATKDIIKNPVNPYTGTPILSEENKINGVVVTSSSKHNFNQHNKNTFNIQKDEWFTVKDNLFDLANWKEGTNE